MSALGLAGSVKGPTMSAKNLESGRSGVWSVDDRKSGIRGVEWVNWGDIRLAVVQSSGQQAVKVVRAYWKHSSLICAVLHLLPCHSAAKTVVWSLCLLCLVSCLCASAPQSG